MPIGNPVGIDTFFDNFYGAALRGEVAGVTENSGTAAIVVGQEGGVAGLVTGATSTNRSLINMGLNWKAGSGSMYFETRVKSVTAITTRALFIGFTDTVAIENPIQLATATVTSNASDAVGFLYDTAATTAKWFMAGVKGDVDTAFSAVNLDNVQQAPVADEWQTFGVELNSDGVAVLYFGRDNGSKYGLREVGRIANAVTPTVLLTPIVCVETRTTAAKTAYVDYFKIRGGGAG